MSDPRNPLKEVQTGGVPRRGNCRIRRLAQKARDLVLSLGNGRRQRGSNRELSWRAEIASELRPDSMTTPELRQPTRIALYKLQCLETSWRECRGRFSLSCRCGNGVGSNNVI
jgi:hypothetical protein